MISTIQSCVIAGTFCFASKMAARAKHIKNMYTAFTCQTAVGISNKFERSDHLHTYVVHFASTIWFAAQNSRQSHK
jgi:hypothetical protein